MGAEDAEVGWLEVFLDPVEAGKGVVDWDGEFVDLGVLFFFVVIVVVVVVVVGFWWGW